MTDLADRLRHLADHIDRHDLPNVSIYLGTRGHLDLVADSQRAVTDWATSLHATVHRTVRPDSNLGPAVLYATTGHLGHTRLSLNFWDRAEAETLRTCGCNWRNLCDSCHAMSTPEEVGRLRGVA